MAPVPASTEQQGQASSAFGLSLVFLPIALHCCSRGLLLFKLARGANCSSISLVALDLYVLVYILRYAGLLVKFEGWSEVAGVVRIVLSLGAALLLRYQPHASRTYDDKIDSIPRFILILPALVLGLVFSKVKMIVEICHQCSFYLEPLVLLPQFVVLYRRKNFPNWVLAFTALSGLEGAVTNWRVFSDMWVGGRDFLRQDFFKRHLAAEIQVGILCVGVLFVLLKRHTGEPRDLNESEEKPTFDEVWEAQKFTFQENAGSGSRLV